MNYYWLLLPAAMLVLAVVCFWDVPNDSTIGDEDEDSSENQVGSGEGE